jgi:phosphoglycolate phosphatase
MTHIANVLFDLDGTLLDPADGITQSIQYALTKLEQPALARQDLLAYIGPPLRGTFASLLQTEDSAHVEQAMTLFRERFATIGLFEGQLYDGIVKMFDDLQRLPVRMFLATAKPRVYAERMLVHFELAHYFIGVYGSELDGRFDFKGDLLAHLLPTEGLAPAETVMVGDREHDIMAARQNGLWSIGVTYGYGSVDELRAAGADRLATKPGEVVDYVAVGLAG